MLRPILFTLFTYDCTPIYTSNTIIKCADDTTAAGLISDNEETVYRHEVGNGLILNTSKTKEVIIDFRKTKRNEHTRLHIHGEVVERVKDVQFL